MHAITVSKICLASGWCRGTIPLAPKILMFLVDGVRSFRCAHDLDRGTRRDRRPRYTVNAPMTRPNAAIGRYLQGFGRYGIPFNAVYGPAVPEGRALPELLTPDEVATALDHSRKGG